MTELDQDQNIEEPIAKIIETLPENEWLDAIRKALPGVSDLAILSTIEALTGGDVHGVDG